MAVMVVLLCFSSTKRVRQIIKIINVPLIRSRSYNWSLWSM